MQGGRACAGATVTRVRWILLDLAIALVALAVLAVLVLRLWRAVKALSSAVSAAGQTLATATDALAAAQAQGPLGGTSAGYGPPPLPASSPARPPSSRRQDRPRTGPGA